MDPQPQNSNQPTLGLSNYARSLDVETNARYRVKIQVLGNLDPYLLLQDDSKWKINFDEFPDVTSSDIFNYVVLGTSYYTGEDFKAYKSLAAYQYCDSGFMRNVRFSKIEPVFLLCGEVLHSQRLNEPPLSPWVIVDANGTAVSGHCTCMAGLGECCSHIAALLFFVEGICRRRSRRGLTEDSAYWVPPAGHKVADPICLKSIDFRTAIKKSKEDVIPQIKMILPKTDHVFGNLLNDLKDLAIEKKMKPSYILLTTTKEEDEFEKFPVVYNRLFEEDYLDLSYEELCTIGHSFDFTLTQLQCDYIEKHSRSQSNSIKWFHFRAGRVTASVVHSVCRVKAFDSNPTLISKICYPQRSRMNIPALKWGCRHEGAAVQAYLKKIASSHTTKITTFHSGLIVCPEYPHLGASPDLLISCECCGKGCLEVKCPYCCIYKSINDIPYLRGEDGKLSLDPGHQYYYQIQLQIFLSKSQYGDFLVWSPDQEPHYERLSLDEAVIQEIITKSSIFFRESLLPELLGKYFTTTSLDEDDDAAVTGPSSGTENPFCVCNTTAKGKTVVCTKNGCKYAKYHLKCLSLKRMPRSKKWVCPYCKPAKPVTTKQ